MKQHKVAVVAAIALGALGGCELSIDDALDLADALQGWTGLAITAGAGIGLGAAVLALFWRPTPKA